MAQITRMIVLLGAASLLVTGCSGVDQWPHSAADEKANVSIVAGGGDPRDWILDNRCGNAGPCGAELSPAVAPDLVLAVNRFRIKDSFPTAVGPDRIRAVVARVERADCLRRFSAAAPLARCATGSTAVDPG